MLAPPMVASKSKSAPKRSRKIVTTEAEPAEARDGDGEQIEAADDDDSDSEKPDEGVDVEMLGQVAAVPSGSDDDAADVEVVESNSEEVPSVGKSSGLARRDPMAVYMGEVRRFPLLTPEEEHALAVRLVEHGDNTAARKLVEANLRLVVKIAYEYRRAHRNLLDLVQEGNIGLMQAVSKFDPYRGVKLSSYAAFWIRAYILKFILNNWRLVKIGTTQAQRKLFFNLRKEREKLEQLGFAPTAKALAEKLDVTENEVIEMEKRLSSPEASLDAPVGSEDDGQRTRLDFLPSETARPDQAVANNEFASLLRSKLEEFASDLEGRDQHIFRERWLTDEPQTLQEIGDKYGVSRERARQLEKRMLDRLRKFLESELGSAVDIGAMSRDE
jgi:RNA polymerase sigma-32 factor